MHRLRELKKILTKDKVDGFLITNAINVHYVTGFSGSESILLVTPDKDYLLTDFRYLEQAQREMPEVNIVERKVSLIKTACTKLRRLHIKKLYFESSLGFNQYAEIKKNVSKMRMIPAPGIIENYRRLKTQEEIKKIQTAIDIAEGAYRDVRKKLKAGVSEKNLADILEFEIRNHGGEKGSFDIICAAGTHTSQPHARPTERKIENNDAVLIDWGAKFQFYNSDLTRVILIDKISPKYKEMYQIVFDAQRFAIDSVSPGVMAKDVDYAARSYIEKKGLGKCFGHGTGHGIGLEVHEGPFVNRKSKELLKDGMVFTIEPGVYVPGWGGVRIEDIVRVTKDGCNILSHEPKKLSEIYL